MTNDLNSRSTDPERSADDSSSRVTELDPWSIEPLDGSPVEDVDGAVTASMASPTGQIHEVTVSRGWLVCGRKRVAAARTLGIPVRATIRDDIPEDAEAHRRFRLEENYARGNPSLSERAALLHAAEELAQVAAADARRAGAKRSAALLHGSTVGDEKLPSPTLGDGNFSSPSKEGPESAEALAARMVAEGVLPESVAAQIVVTSGPVRDRVRAGLGAPQDKVKAHHELLALAEAAPADLKPALNGLVAKSDHDEDPGRQLKKAEALLASTMETADERERRLRCQALLPWLNGLAAAVTAAEKLTVDDVRFVLENDRAGVQEWESGLYHLELLQKRVTELAAALQRPHLRAV